MKNLFMVLSLVFVFSLNLYSGIKYVNSNASGLNDGTTWANAYTSFQSALTAATSGDQIWVAKGTYKPSSAYDLTNTSRYYHFRMINGVTIYGGFAGTETATSQRTNFGAGQTNETILSGDLNDNGKDDNDCYHVFYQPSGLASSAILDGFTIKGGNANNSAWPHDYGGGMYNYSSSPTLTNCTFTSNSASLYHGGGMCNQAYSSPTLTNCTFTSNSASDYGGGMFNSESSSTLNNCIIWGNTATRNGDELCLIVGTITLNYSCYASDPGDVYIYSGTFTASNNNITSDPQFVGSSINPTHPYSILGTSPCADAGNDSYNNTQDYDIRGVGYPRRLNKTTGADGTIDMGTYEYKLNVDALPVELTSFAASANGATVMLHWQTATEVNNYGFEVERIRNEELGIRNWGKIGFVEGSGNSNSPKEYSFIDNNLGAGKYVYRLKQIDNDGKHQYSKEVEVEVNQLPTEFSLEQNYPNPFNPSTVMSYALPFDSKVIIRIYNTLGQEVASLKDEISSAGNYEVQFNSSSLPSGIYFYRLNAESVDGKQKYAEIKKMILLK